jgi:hypothetical protein
MYFPRKRRKKKPERMDLRFFCLYFEGNGILGGYRFLLVRQMDGNPAHISPLQHAFQHFDLHRFSQDLFPDTFVKSRPAVAVIFR